MDTLEKITKIKDVISFTIDQGKFIDNFIDNFIKSYKEDKEEIKEVLNYIPI